MSVRVDQSGSNNGVRPIEALAASIFRIDLTARAGLHDVVSRNRDRAVLDQPPGGIHGDLPAPGPDGVHLGPAVRSAGNSECQQHADANRLIKMTHQMPSEKDL